jgi:hypothetical protein
MLPQLTVLPNSGWSHLLPWILTIILGQETCVELNNWCANMNINLETPGISTFPSEVTSVGIHGFWLLLDDQEYFVAFADYPAFRQAKVTELFHVRQLSPNQLHWPDLDIDIDIDALENPDKFPLVWHS